MVTTFKGILMIYILFFLTLIFATTFLKTKARKVTLQNDEGHTIVLQGTYHIADTHFYQSIFSDLSHYRNKNFNVLYELVVAQDPKKGKKKKLLSKRMANYFSQILKSDNQQHYIAQYQQSDIRADVYLEDALLHIKDNSLNKQDIAVLFKINQFINKYKLNNLTRYFLNILFYTSTFKDSLFPKENNNFIIGTRNKVVLNHINIDPTKNAYVHYGEGHITDLILRLQKQNYKVVSCEYLTPFP